MYLGGAPNNVEEIYKLKNIIIIIDDACYAFGSFIVKGKKVMVGSNTRYFNIFFSPFKGHYYC